MSFEEGGPFRTHVTFSEERELKNQSNRRKKVLLAPHPWVLYRQSAGYQIVPNAHGAVAFLPHESDVATHEPYDYADYVRRLLTEKSFGPLRALCISGNDIRFRNRHTEMRSLGVPLVTAGDPASPYFVDRFYSLMSHFLFAASCNPGSEMLYLTEMGHDFWCTDTVDNWPILRTRRRDYYLDGRVVPAEGSDDDRIQRETVRIFNNRLSDKETKFAFSAKFLGLSAPREETRHHLRRISLSALLRRPDIVIRAYVRFTILALKNSPKIWTLYRKI